MPWWKKSRNSRQASAPPVQSTDNADDSFLQEAAALIAAEVRMISGCHSEQTSADLHNVRHVANQLPDPAGRAGGACTSALLDILYQEGPELGKEQKMLTFQDLLLKLRESLAASGLSQIPQLTSSRPLDVKETPFHLVGGNGRRRALLVGINYRGQNGELSGCHNDVFNVKKYIQQVHGFPEQDVTTMLDDDCHSIPTRQKIIAELRRLVSVSMAGDSVYFHYSGHGGLLASDFNPFKSATTKEYEETLIPLDHKWAGEIRDFSLFNHFVKPMRAGVTVTAVIDACHSGSVLDLPYTFRPTAAGEVRMRSSMDQLSNLAFLYILAGGMLPHGMFPGVMANLDQTLDGNVDDYQGTGLEAADADGAAFDQDGGFVDSGYGDTGYGDMDPGNEETGLGDMGPGNDDAGLGDTGPGYDGAGLGDTSPGFDGALRDGPGGLEGDGPPGLFPGLPVANDMGDDPIVVPGQAVPGMQDTGGFGDVAGGNPYGGDFAYDGADGGAGVDGADCDCDCGDIVSDILDSAGDLDF